METEKKFLSKIYDRLLEVEAVLNVICMSRRAINDTQIIPEIESVYIATESLKRNISEVTNRIDERIYTRL